MANKPGEANFFPDVPQFPSMGTFQPVYGKFDLTTYIQGASDYEIMAFLVGKYNATLEAYGTATKLSTDTITAAHQLQDWINNWFDNLDVQEELNNKIDSMVQDGSFGTLLHQTFDAQINQQTTSAVTAWLVANVTPTGSAVVVDKSLSIEGAAADAKEVGDHLLRVNEGFYTKDTKPFNHTKDLNNITNSKCLLLQIDTDPKINEENHTPPFKSQMLSQTQIMTLLNITPELGDDGTFQLGYIRGLNETAPYLYYRSRRKVDTDDKWTHWALISDTRTCFTSNNIQYNSEFPPLYNNLNYYTDNKAYEFDIGFTSEQIENAPFYPFKGTLLCFNPNYYDFQQNEKDFTTVGTVQLVFKSRNVFDYKPELYFRCCLSGVPRTASWSPWAKLTPETQNNSSFNFTPIECIEDFCVLGDSISAGFTDIGGINISSAQGVARKANWPSYMELNIGRTVENLAVGGSSTQTWRNNLLTKLTKHECYIVYIGGNDIAGNVAVGSPSDIVADYNNNQNSYYGNYDYIIRYIHNYNPKAIIFCISNTRWDCSSNKYLDYNRAVKYISELYDYAYYIDITNFASADNKLLAQNFNGHFSPLGYSIYGKYIQRAINEYMCSNPTKFLAVPYNLK